MLNVQQPPSHPNFDSTQSTGIDSGDSQSPRGTTSASTAFEESENSESSLWTTSDFHHQTDADGENDDDGTEENDALMLGPVSQLSQISQMSQWSEFSSTSNLDEIITFLEKQDTVETERYSGRVCHWS